MNLSIFKFKPSIIIILAIGIILIFGFGNNLSTVSADEHSYDGLVDIKKTEVDAFGNLFVLGQTEKEDIYLAKFQFNGTLLWYDTFGGSETDLAENFMIDGLGNLYVVGITYSSDFDVTPDASQLNFGGLSDYFIRKWNGDGELQWSTYLGGSDIEA